MKFKRIMGCCCCVAFFSAGHRQVMAKDVTLNFKNADIRAFIDFVADFSSKNFLVDNRVKGKVTIVSPTAISEEHAYEIFLSVLEVNGFAAVPSGAVVKIVPRAESKQKALPVRMGEGVSDDAMVTQVIRLKYADAQQLVALIRPLISPNSHLVAYPRGNMLLLTDSASNIQRLQYILSLLDRKGCCRCAAVYPQVCLGGQVGHNINKSVWRSRSCCGPTGSRGWKYEGNSASARQYGLLS